MSADKPAFDQKSHDRQARRVVTTDRSLLPRAILRAAVYAGLIALSILLWWAIIRLFFS